MDNSKADFFFSIYNIFCTLRFQIFKELYLCQILSFPSKYINGKLIQLSDDKLTGMTDFVIQVDTHLKITVYYRYTYCITCDINL